MQLFTVGEGMAADDVKDADDTVDILMAFLKRIQKVSGSKRVSFM